MRLIDGDRDAEREFLASLHGARLHKPGGAPGGSPLRRAHDRIAARLKGRR